MVDDDEEYEEYDEDEVGSEDEQALLVAQHEADVMQILAEYRQRQLREHLTGPIISFAVHVIVLCLLTYFVRGKVQEEPPPIEVVVEEVEIKELEEPVIEEIEEVEEAEVAEEAPAMEVQAPTPTESTDTAMEDVSDDAPETEDNMDMEAVSDVVTANTALKLPGLYGGRSAGGRAGAVRRFGGSKRGQDAVLKALRWLARVQQADGSWVGHPGFSGLATLCFLAYGATPLSDEFGLTVQKALNWLAHYMPAGDQLYGARLEKKHAGGAYAHAIATYAISEAYGMTQIPFLRSAMETGIAKVVNGQQRRTGAWDYFYAKGKRWDLSVTTWNIQALKAAFVAGSGTPGVPNAIEKAIDCLKHRAYKDKHFIYSNSGTNQYAATMPGLGSLSLQLLGEKRSSEAKSGVDTIMIQRYPRMVQYANGSHDHFDEHAGGDLYAFYYDTQAIFQSGGPNWKKWNKAFEKCYVKHQNEEGYWQVYKGDRFGHHLQGRVYATTLCTLQLEVYYRYLPTFKMPKAGFLKEAKENSLFGDEDDLIIE